MKILGVKFKDNDRKLNDTQIFHFMTKCRLNTYRHIRWDALTKQTVEFYEKRNKTNVDNMKCMAK